MSILDATTSAEEARTALSLRKGVILAPSEAVAVRQAVGVQNDGDLVAAVKNAFYAEAQWISDSGVFGIARLTATTFFVAFQDQAGTNDGLGLVATIATSGAVSFGGSLQFEANVAANIDCAALDATHVVVVWEDATTGPNALESAVATISGQTVSSYGTMATVLASANVDHLAYKGLDVLDSTHFAVAYTTGTAIQSRVGVVSEGDSIAYGNQVQAFSGVGAGGTFTSPVVTALDATHFLVAVTEVTASGSDGRVAAATVSSEDIIAYGAEQEFYNGAGGESRYIDMARADSTAALLVYPTVNDASTGEVSARVVRTDGANVVSLDLPIKSIYVGATDATFNGLAVENIGAGDFLMAVHDSIPTPNTFLLFVLRISGSSIEVLQLGTAGTTEDPEYLKLLSMGGNRFVAAYYQTGVGGDGTARAFDVLSPLGIVPAALSSGTAGRIVAKGETIEGFFGLTPGGAVFADSSGVISGDVSGRYVGRAISSSEVLVDVAP